MRCWLMIQTCKALNRMLKNYCGAMMLRWKPSQNAGSRSDILCVNRICDTLTGEASRLREQMQAALPAPGCFATPCQSGYFFVSFRLA